MLALQAMGGAGRVRLTESEAAEVDVVRRLVESYFAISRKNLSDLVPKAIMHFLVHYTKRGLQQHLIKSLYRDDLLDALLTEADDVVVRRGAAKEAVSVLRAAVAALDEVPHELAGGGVSSAFSFAAAVAAAGMPLANGAAPAAAPAPAAANPLASLGTAGPGVPYQFGGVFDRSQSMAAAANLAATAAAQLSGTSLRAHPHEGP